MKINLTPTIDGASKVLLTTLMLLMVGAVGLPLSADIAARREAAGAVASTRIALAVFNALQNARMERGPTMAALTAAKPASPRFVAQMDGYRAADEPALRATMEECRNFRCADDEKVAAGLATAQERRAVVRREVDEDLRKPLTERRPNLAARFTERSTDVIAQLEVISVSLGARIQLADAETAGLIEIKELTWLARDGFGLERREIGLALGAGAMIPAHDERYQRLRGQGDSAWGVVLALIARPGVPPEIKAAAAAADGQIKTYRALSDALHDDLVAGLPSNTSNDELTDVSNRALGAMTDVAGTAMRLAQHRALERWDATNRNLVLRLGVLALACLFSLSGLVIVQRFLIRPMHAITRAMGALASGDEHVAIVGATRADEFGALVKAFEVFRQGMIRQKAMEREGDATKVRMEDEKRRALADLGHSFEATVSGLVGTLAVAATDLKATAGAMSSTAERTRERSGLVMTAAASAARNVAAASTASRDLSASAEEVGTQIHQTATIAAQAVIDAQRSRDTIEALVSEATAIGGVVTLINQIASRTNLLALNATIEAARAGESGRGFSVVASEVKDLANQTIHATVQIRARIDAIQQATEGAAAAISSVSAVVNDVHGIARTIAAAAERQRAATRNIAAEMAEAARGAGVLTDETAQVRDTADTTGTSATSVLAAAGELANCSTRLDGEVRRFLDHLRAA